MTDDQVSTADTMRERADESRLKLWLLVGANRLVVTAVLTVSFFVLFSLGTVFEPGLSTLLRNRNVIAWVFATMITADITIATLVVTIGQLILSQENGPLGDQQQRMSMAMDFRGYVSELVDEPAPADPSAFLRVLVNAARTRALALEDATEGLSNEAAAEEFDEFTSSVLGNADTVTDKLDGARFGTFDVVHAALDFNYGWKVFQTQRLEDEYADVLDEEQRTALQDLRQSLAMFGPAREHVKTLYFQWDLINLSRLIFYASVPALLVSGMMVTYVDATTVVGTTLGVQNLLWLVAGAFTFTLVPFFLLLAYILRITTVAKRTLAIGPLILRDSQR
ncbi:hypothetical protein [Natronosalvus rutilus]|uniref:DUF4239 domain-containing protein n=1 Tax=Natronosalvus rutilus TaxID=2953753 RepID=A0A9E7NAK1_9EURY|nr:hypothetical protein [Natronosalvus rutilus]UTF53866.1 hypothetical protein NGM29_00855 [Natronosalvus rutilus]